MIDLYKIEEVNNNRFYQVPKELFQNPCYRFNLTTDAKLVYGKPARKPGCFSAGMNGRF